MKAAATLALVLAGLLAWAALAARETLPDYDDMTPAQQRRERAASDLCRSEFGPEALYFWTAEGHLVCRRGRSLL